MNSEDENETFKDGIVTLLVARPKIIPIGSLVVFFHAMLGLDASVTQFRDSAEARNYRVFLELRGALDSKLVGPEISGSFKPAEFVHPFENHYSTPGYLDIMLLPRFFDATDSLAINGVSKESRKDFLAFVYVTFLLIHPFVDGNGRVARALLDYYDRKLEFGLDRSWNEKKPKKFDHDSAHKEAFQTFFRSIGLKPRYSLSLHPIPDELRPEFVKMADNLLYEISRAADNTTVEGWKPVQLLASIIK